MKQKPVSYEVAKALKEVGYPQANNDLYYNENGTVRCCSPHTFTVTYACPTYFDAWLWIWRKKEIRICLYDAKNPKEPEIERGCYVGTDQLGGICSPQEFADPEEAIVDIINYLIENNLINRTMQKIMFNDKYRLTQAVLDGIKTQTRRIIPLTDVDREYLDTAFDWDLRESVIIDEYARYKEDEEVAVAQAYKDIPSISDTNYVDVDWERAIKNKPFGKWGCANKLSGWNNKMYVRADLMPHRIKITNIRVERLQDISDEDCLKEGVRTDGYQQKYYTVSGFKKHYSTPQEAFSYLIDKLSGKGTWENNPYVFVYEFELIK